jgi:cytoskeletal protein RodZ
VNIDTLLMWIVGGLVAVIGIPFTLWWWKIADKWADAEKRRFKPKADTRERIVVRGKMQDPPASSR